MNRKLTILALAVFLLGIPSAAFSAPNQVLLLFNGNTEVNRHIYSTLTQVLGGVGFKVVATLSTSAAVPGVYKAVVVVSTKTTTGVDPTLEAFLKSYSAPQELYLVDLLSRSGSLAVTTFTKDSPQGVDGVTAATAWTMNSQQMHAHWMQILAQRLAGK